MLELQDHLRVVRDAATLGYVGRVNALRGLTITVSGLPVPVGSACVVETIGGPVDAEVIGFTDGRALLMPLSDSGGVAPGQAVRFISPVRTIAVGSPLLGRVIDGRGRPIDGGPVPGGLRPRPLARPAPAAMERRPIDRPLSVGVRAINALLTVGQGQRLGLFAGTGVGKSVLLGMMARYTSADVVVVALVGERGREVQSFIAKDLGPAGLRRSVVVVSTSDQSPVLRVRALLAATTVAEQFRAEGADVLLLVDSVTRVAMAQRQIGLAAGEPPTTKGYPPSVFALLPQVLERAGRTASGSVTGLYTVLVEGDDLNEPIADAARGVLDGHVWLSRRLASRGHFPAVDVLESISRVMTDVASPEQAAAARRVRRLLAVWSEIEDLVNIGAYAPGANPEFDLVIRTRPAVERFLTQAVEDSATMEQAVQALAALTAEVDRVEATLRGRSPAGEAAPRMEALRK